MTTTIGASRQISQLLPRGQILSLRLVRLHCHPNCIYRSQAQPRCQVQELHDIKPARASLNSR